MIDEKKLIDELHEIRKTCDTKYADKFDKGVVAGIDTAIHLLVTADKAGECSFNGYDKETVTMRRDLVYLAKALCTVCYSQDMSYHDLEDFVSIIRLLYDYTVSEKEGDEQ